MPLYAYRAIDDEGKDVHGTIEAADTERARAILENDMHLDVQEIAEPTRQRANANGPAVTDRMQTFAFEGKDARGYSRRGTIQAENRRQAFDRLRRDQKLTLAMLSAVGQPPPATDEELMAWQREVPVRVNSGPASAPVMPIAGQSQAAAPAAPAGIAAKAEEPHEWQADASAVEQSQAREFAPLVATLQLYSGWLLAWYALFVGIGHYATVRQFPLEIPLAQGFYLSPLIFSFVIAIFLFLLMSALHRWMRAGAIGGILLGILGVAAFLIVEINL